MKIYVASSWRNELQPTVVTVLREHGFDVYDFKNPVEGDHGFEWVDTGIHNGPIYVDALHRALHTGPAQAGFKQDHAAMKWADICLLVLPAGRSAHMEVGWFMGQGKPVVIYAAEPIEPELMYLLGPDVTMYRDFHVVVAHLSILHRSMETKS